MLSRSIIIKIFNAASLALLFVLAGCEDEDPPLASNYVNFESQEMGIGADEESLTVNLSFSSAAAENTQLTLNVELNGVEHGVHFETSPEISNNSLTLPVEAGALKASFQLTIKDGVVLTGEETVKFTIGRTGNALEIGERTILQIQFSEIIAESATMDPDVGGALQPNKVFVDLSTSRQTSVPRNAWDLGLFMEAGQFRVILNSSAAMLARPLDKSDLNAVSAQDTLGWGAQLSTDAIFGGITSDVMPDWISEAVDWVDAPSGDMTGTAIAEIASQEEENKVYIINRGKNPDGTSRGWKKIRVIRDGDGYELQHADIGDDAFESVKVARDESYYFKYIKFEDGVVDIEPRKDKWDIAFTVFINTTPVSQTVTVPYTYNDIVLQNRYNTTTAEVLTSNFGTYEEFSADDIDDVTSFSSSQINIGSKWRSGGGPGSGPALREDRFYLVKDAAGNVYKLRFTALTQNGERGRPQIQFELLKAG